MLRRLSLRTTSRNTTRRTIEAEWLSKVNPKRSAPQTDDGNEANDANTYASERDCPKSRDEFQEEHIIVSAERMS